MRVAAIAAEEVKRLQIYNGYVQHLTAIPQRKKVVSVRVYSSGYVTAVSVVQRQWLNSGVRIFTGYYPRSQLPLK
jgi:hypothetical protein